MFLSFHIFLFFGFIYYAKRYGHLEA